MASGRDSVMGIPTRKGQRLELIDAALESLRDHLSAASWERLRAGPTLTIGIEPLIALEDVYGASQDEALRAMQWVLDAILAAAEREALIPFPNRSRA